MNKHRNNLLVATQVCVALLSIVLIAEAVHARRPAPEDSDRGGARRDAAGRPRLRLSDFLAQARSTTRAGFSLMPSSRHANTNRSGPRATAAVTPAATPAVLGGGTVGQISKWVATAPSGNSILGDSIITEFNSNIGIGLTSPGSKLTVQGMIETTLGGYKFPDGTVQTTAAVSGLTSVAHGSTLVGDGTAGSPLNVAVPLKLEGFDSYTLLQITNLATGGDGVTVSASFGTGVNAFGDRRGIRARGGNAGGDGMLAGGGFGIKAGLGFRACGGGTDILGGTGGVGVLAVGGDSFKGTPGDGVVATGGFTEFGLGSAGVRATGGDSIELVGGIGVRAEGG